MIRITYEARHTVPIEDVADFQGDVKTITQENLDRLKASIRKHGFFVPLFVWRKSEKSTTYIIDGHQRRKALLELRDDGEEIPIERYIRWCEANDVKTVVERIDAPNKNAGKTDG